MISKLWHSPAARWLRKGRVAILALAVVAAVAVWMSVSAYKAGGPGTDDSRPMTLEEMERSGIVVLAFAHNNADALSNKLSTDDRSFIVKIKADGLVTEHRANWGDSVEEVLDRSGIVLGEEDQLSHMLYRPVEPNETIYVERWTRDTVAVETEIPGEVVQIPTSLLAAGKQRTLSEGTPGRKETVYNLVLKDGVVMEKTLVSEEVVAQPVNGTVLVGTVGAPVSPLKLEGEELDESGIPTEYEAVLSAQRAAGYSAKPGAGTASGRKAAVGHVAVNPNVIPYGTKLYIRSADGGFVYGYAIAADTGTGLMQGIIDVDLFYGSYLESCLNGMRSVDIYILEYPS